MNRPAKILLGIGGVLLVVAIIVASWGGYSFDSGSGSPDSEDWSGFLLWEGETPATYTGEFTWTSTYNVWVEEGSDVEVIVSGEGRGYWESCENLEDCWIFDEDGKIPGYEYIGEIWIDPGESGTYTIEFSTSDGSEVGLMIREDKSFGGFIGMLASCGICCFAILFLIIGAISASFGNKNNPTSFVVTNSINSDDTVVVQNELEQIEESTSTENDAEWWDQKNQ